MISRKSRLFSTHSAPVDSSDDTDKQRRSPAGSGNWEFLSPPPPPVGSGKRQQDFGRMGARGGTLEGGARLCFGCGWPRTVPGMSAAQLEITSAPLT
ncbi:hypothetical protein JTB14_000547 [Gonioctena quinquepunctata]|nr:hypothetical protein JTB14_000547 [Gonioctena quinquepunctata]